MTAERRKIITLRCFQLKFKET